MKIIIADDHALFRDGLAIFMEQFGKDIHILQTINFAQTLKMLEQEKNIDILILDLDMPDMPWEEGLEKISQIMEKEAKLVVMSASEDIKAVKKSIELGAKGFISKRSDPKIIESAINLIISGGVYLPHEILNKHIISPVLNGNKTDKVSNLTERQEQVLRLISLGLSNKQIAYELGVTESTVKLHINSLLRNLGVTNRTKAVVTAQKMGIL
ncbi:MAG: LuxR C-terminal-related transcriptional regulator [Alphaproteobacteria bacterium]